MKQTDESELKKEVMHNRSEKTTTSSRACSESYDLIIIGAGPAGLFCAINSREKSGKGSLQRDGKKILLLEKKQSPSRKLLISGSGQCNITHEGNIHNFLSHYGDRGRFLRPALLGFTNQDLVTYFEARDLGMISEPGGKIFPGTRKARDVLDILVEECKRSEIEMQCQKEVISAILAEGEFHIGCNDCAYHSKRLVIATGGCSYPATGSTGDGYRLARSLGHSLMDIGPALTPVIIKDHPFSDMAGISFPEMKISLYHNHKKTREIQGSLLFTHEGLSGPAILDLSRYIRPGDTLKLSIVPQEPQALDEQLVGISRKDGARSLKSILQGISQTYSLPSRLMGRILDISGIDSALSISYLPREARKSLIENLIALPLVVQDLGGFDVAMVTRGGVDSREVDPKTMESRLVPGLYLVGEVLDVDGDTGGYNLQSCFSTGILAARSIKKSWL